MSKKYFGTDGIRGRANSFPMTPEIAMKVGMAAGVAFRRGKYRHRVVIGKDTRRSGYMIENALVSGLASAGMDVFQLGPVPTPAVAMLTRSLRADMGAMISASHNPFEDNGIKLFGPDGFKLSDELEAQIEALIDEDLSDRLQDGSVIGRVTRDDGALYRYIEFAKRTFPRSMNLTGMRVVVDCANGAAYKAAPAVLWELGAEVVTIGNEPNGLNINEDCGSTKPGALMRKVSEVRADLGIALDGDADRVLMVDEKGEVIDGDQLMATIGQSWKEADRLTGDGIVATIMSNLGLERFLSDEGMALARTKVGDRFVVEHMRKHGYNVGGEQSGHIVLTDYVTTGDGLISALQILACLKNSDKPASFACRKFEPVPQVLKNARFNGGKPLEDEQVKEAIQEAKVELGNSGRLVIRPSGTEPLIRVMAEGDDKVLVNKVVTSLVDLISSLKTAA